MPDEAVPGLGLASTERVMSPLTCTAPKLGDWLMGTSFFTPSMAACSVEPLRFESCDARCGIGGVGPVREYKP